MKKSIKPFHFSFLDKILIIYLIIGVLGLINIKSVENSFKTIYLQYAEKEARKITSIFISDIVSKQLDVESEVVISLIEDESGKIKGLDFNTRLITKTVNQILDELINSIDQLSSNKKDSNEDVMVMFIPFGIVNNNVLLSNMGPLIPVKLNFIGDSKVQPFCSVKAYGINNSFVEIVFKIEVNIQMLFPLISKTLKFQYDYPFAMKYIQGEIPSSYIGTIPLLE